MRKRLTRFTEAQEQTLIEMVKSNAVLYNADWKDHKNVSLKDSIWKHIADTMGTHVKSVKTRWKSLRDLYLRKRKLLSGDPLKANDTWEYMDALSFLDDVHQRKSHTKADIICLPSTQIAKQEHETLTERTLTPPIYIELCQKERYSDDDSASIGPESDSRNFENTEIRINRHTTHKRKFEEAFESSRETDRRNYPVKLFFESLAETVMTFPPELAVEAKLKVCQVISELELKLLKQK